MAKEHGLLAGRWASDRHGRGVGRVRRRVTGRVASGLLALCVAVGPCAPGATAAASSGAQTYTVKRGDTLSRIAAAYGVNLAALEAANTLADPNMITPGQVLYIPSGASPAKTGEAGDGAAPAGVQAANGVQRAVDLQFTKTPVTEVLRVLASSAGLGYIGLSDLDQPISLSLHDQEIQTALDLVSRATGIAYIVQSGTLIAGTSAEIARFAVQPGPTVPAAAKRVDATAATADARVISALWRLNYADPQKLQQVLAQQFPALKVQADAEAHLLTVQGTAADLEAAHAFVGEYDQPPPEVLVEARLEEINRNVLSQLGITWSLPASFSTGAQFAASALGSAQLMARLDALENEGKSHLLAAPRVATLSDKQASIFIGDNVPVLLKGDANHPETIQTFSAGVKLQITPTVAGDGTITVNVDANVSSITGMVTTGTGSQLPQTRSREAQTQIRVRDGQPIVIGGLVSRQLNDTVSGLPILKEFPIYGSLFTTQRNDQTQSDMVIFLIPHIVTPDAPPATGSGAAGASSEGGAPEASAAGAAGAALSSGASGWAPGVGGGVDAASRYMLHVDVSSDTYRLSIERGVGNIGFSTGLVSMPLTVDGASQRAWGLTLDWRRSLGSAWVDLGAAGLAAASAAGSTEYAGTQLRLGLGLQLQIPHTPLTVEPYVEWTKGLPPGGLNVAYPHHDGQLGLRIGWQL